MLLEAQACWEAARSKVREELGWIRTDPWLDQVRARSLRRGVMVLEVGSSAERGPLYDNKDCLKAALADVLGRPVQLRVAIAKKPRRKQREPDDLPPLSAERTNTQHQLDSFLTGPANELPLRFAQQAVERPGHWHPLVFYGGSGSGKTHLLQGIVNGYRRQYPMRRAVYTSSDRFSRQFVQAIRHRQTHRFRQLYRSVDLLAVDDLQDMAGKAKSERELTHTLDHLLHAARQVVVACSETPKRIPQLEQSLEGRLVGGQVVEVKPPDPGTRLEIVRACSARRGLRLGTGVVDALASRCELDVRELLAVLTRLEAHQQLAHTRLDVPMVRRMLDDQLEGKLKPPTLDAVTAFVAERLVVGVDQLRSRSRKPTVVRARQICMGLLRDLSHLTLREVGVFFGNRSPASVHFAQERARELREADTQLQELWDQARRVFQTTSRH